MTGTPCSITLTVHEVGGSTGSSHLDVTHLFNFGYAGRDQSAVTSHVEELRELGLPAPHVVPAIFPLPATGVTTSEDVAVSGTHTYGEVEYALLLSPDEGWLVAVASDHSDFEVEKTSVSRSKAICPDVVSSDCWRLADVERQWDSLRLTSSRTDVTSTAIVQEGLLRDLLAPAQLISILEGRLRGPLQPGTVVLSGTIGGEPSPGASRWQVELHDPDLKRSLIHSYAVTALADELAAV